MPEDFMIEIDVTDAKQVMESDEDVLLIDCREQREWDHVHLDRFQLVPMQETPQRLEEFAPYQDKRIIVQCHHGMRSLQVVQYLRKQGFDKAQSMAGGIDRWSVVVDDSVLRY